MKVTRYKVTVYNKEYDREVYEHAFNWQVFNGVLCVSTRDRKTDKKRTDLFSRDSWTFVEVEKVKVPWKDR